MKNKMLKKTLAILSIGLFIGLIFAPNLSAAPLKVTNELDKTPNDSPLVSSTGVSKEVVYGIITGLQTNLLYEDGYYVFEAIRILIFPIGGFARSYHNNELIQVREDGMGYIGKYFIFGISYIVTPD